MQHFGQPGKKAQIAQSVPNIDYFIRPFLINSMSPAQIITYSKPGIFVKWQLRTLIGFVEN